LIEVNRSRVQKMKAIEDFIFNRHFFSPLTHKQRETLALRVHDIWITSISGFLPVDINLFIHDVVRELEENNIRISCRTFVRIQGVIAGA